MSEAGTATEHAQKTTNLEKARAVLAAKRASEAASRQESAAPAEGHAAEEAALSPGHVWARVTANGNGRIHTGHDAIPPCVRDDDPRIGLLKGADREKAYAKVFAQACVEAGLSYAKGEVVQLPQSKAEMYEDKGYVEIQ